MTVAEVQALRDKAYTALMNFNFDKVNNSVDGESYDYDSHLKQLEEILEKWDALLIKKQGGAKTYRLNKKVL